MNNNRPTLGQKVTAKASVYREAFYEKGHDEKTIIWRRQETTPVEGLYMGRRFKKEGRWEWRADRERGDYTYFDIHRAVEVWLIVISERMNPICVLPEDAAFEKQAEKDNG